MHTQREFVNFEVYLPLKSQHNITPWINQISQAEKMHPQRPQRGIENFEVLLPLLRTFLSCHEHALYVLYCVRKVLNGAFNGSFFYLRLRRILKGPPSFLSGGLATKCQPTERARFCSLANAKAKSVSSLKFEFDKFPLKCFFPIWICHRVAPTFQFFFSRK